MSNLAALIFSKNRALQVRAAIESLFLRCKDIDLADVVVLYTTTNYLNEKQYQKLMELFPTVNFLNQVVFINQVISVLEQYEYVMYVVDDTIFMQDFKLGVVLKSLNNHKDCVGFSLRLGINTTYHYMGKHDQKLLRKKEGFLTHGPLRVRCLSSIHSPEYLR